MRSRSSTADDRPGEPGAPLETACIPAAEDVPVPTVQTATHEVLFHTVADNRCDACGGALPAAPGADDDGYCLGGQGVYMWTRGDEVCFESAPLCASCASAIGMTALARWEIEEEEG
jgi:hypothetical protein